MKVKKSELKKALSRVGNFVGDKNAITDTSDQINVYKTSDRLSFYSTDNRNAAYASFAIDADGEEYSFSINFKSLNNVCFMKNSEIDLVYDGKELKASDGKSSITIAASENLALQEMPESNQKEVTFSVKQSDFATALSRVAYACDTNSNREFCRGVGFISNDEGITVMGTDGKRAVKSVVGGSFGESKGILHFSFIKAFGLFDDEEISFSVKENFIKVSSDSYSIYCTMIASDYPSLSGILNNEHLSSFVVKRKDMVDSLNLLSRTDSPGIQLELVGSRLNLLVKSSKNEIRDYCDCVSGGEDFEIYVNVMYFNDIFKNVVSDEVSVIFTGKESPIYFDDSQGTFGAVMPLR